MRDALRAGLAGLDDDTNSRTAVAACWHALLGLLAERRLGVLFLEGQQHAAYLSDDSSAVAASVDQIALDVVTRGQASGQIRSGDAGLWVAMVFGAFVGIAKSGTLPTTPITTTTPSLTADAVWALLTQKGTS